MGKPCQRRHIGGDLIHEDPHVQVQCPQTGQFCDLLKTCRVGGPDHQLLQPGHPLQDLDLLCRDVFLIHQVQPLLNLPDLVTFRLGRVASAPVELALDPEALADNPSIQELGFSTCRMEDRATGEALEAEGYRRME